MERMTAAGKTGWILIASLHAGVCVAAACLGPSRALAAALIVSVLSMARYACMSLMAGRFGVARLASIMAASGWVACFVALAAALFVLGRAGSGLLHWGAAAALAGPVSMTALAIGRGAMAIRRDSRGGLDVREVDA